MQTMIDVWIHEGEQKGEQKGRQEGVLALTLRQLQIRVGALDAGTEARIRALSVEQLEQLGEALLDFNIPDDLTGWLRARIPN
ncbi:MAG: DUF4351 domain-containing protein [Blastocatellia bacterium]